MWYFYYVHILFLFFHEVFYALVFDTIKDSLFISYISFRNLNVIRDDFLMCIREN